MKLPYVEVHLTNIFAREPERRHSVLAAGARGLLCGFGAQGYELALRGLVHALRAWPAMTRRARATTRRAPHRDGRRFDSTRSW